MLVIYPYEILVKICMLCGETCFGYDCILRKILISICDCSLVFFLAVIILRSFLKLVRFMSFLSEVDSFLRLGITMKYKKSERVILQILVVLTTIIPVQVTLAESVSKVETIEASAEKVVKVYDNASVIKADGEVTAEVPVLEDESKKTKATTLPSPLKKTSLSTGAKVGIGVGAVVLVGGVIALAGGGGGGSSAPATPPTADSLVSAWQATANQPGSGLTYTGTYHLYQGGAISYAIYVSDGQQLAGGGSWSIEEYQLTIRTEHSVYSGSFAPGNISSVDLNSNTGWNLFLTR